MSNYAVVTGATGSLGGAVARCLWEEGYSLVLLGKTPARCDAMHAWYAAYPRPQQKVIACAIDLSMNTSPDVLYRLNIPALPTLVVTCHGHAPVPAPALEALEPAINVWRCDVLGTLRVCQWMGEQWLMHRMPGSMVLLSSIHAHATYPARLPYALAKSAVVAMARALAVEWGPYGIRVNSLSPWQVSNARTETIAAEEYQASGQETIALYRQKSPLRRLVQPEDVAEAVLMMARNQSMTGQDLILDCGVRASAWHRPFLESLHGRYSSADL